MKDAVADGRLDERRYESYCHLLSGQEEYWTDGDGTLQDATAPSADNPVIR